MRDHLTKYKFDPNTFYKMKNRGEENWGISDDGITQILTQLSPKKVLATTEHTGITDRKTIVTVKVTIETNDGHTWEAVASVSSGEFEQNVWDDRRKYHLAQMAMTRAKNSAVQMAIGATNDDINEIAREIGADKIEQKQIDEGPVIQEEQ